SGQPASKAGPPQGVTCNSCILRQLLYHWSLEDFPMAKMKWAKGLYDSSLDGGLETFTANVPDMTVLADKLRPDVFLVRAIDHDDGNCNGYEYRLELKQYATKK